MTAVHQLLPVLTTGDAISGAARLSQRMFRSMGFESEIYAGAQDRRLQRAARDPEHLADEVNPSDAVIYHLSLDSPLASKWSRIVAHRVVVYHNITPAPFFRPVSARVSWELEAGRAGLSDTLSKAELCVGDSTFNLDEAMAHGATRGVVIPPPVDLTRLHPEPSTPSSPPVILFVGRLAPNKRQDRLIDMLAVLRGTTHPDARLVLAGGSHDTENYVVALRERARYLGVGNAVEIPSSGVSDAALREHYMRSTVFACASEHEGFCVPLLEAFAFDVPVMAFDAGAVRETVGSAGLLLETADPLIWAAAAARLIDDPVIRGHLVAAGRRRLEDFSYDRIRGQYREALAGIGVEP